MKNKNEELLNKKFWVGDFKYLIVGTGRSGTVYLAKLLSSVGIPCSHEGIFSYDGIESSLAKLDKSKPVTLSLISKMASKVDNYEWFKGENVAIEADSSYMAVPFLDNPALDKVSIIHVVREPMEVINSFIIGFNYFREAAMHDKLHKPYHDFIYKYAPRVSSQSTPLSRAAAYYLDWNKMIEEKSKGKRYLFYRLGSNLNKLFNFLGVDSPAHYKNEKANHKQAQNELHSISQIPCEILRKELSDMQKRYFQIKLC